MKNLVVAALKVYRKYLSQLNLQCCRYYPSCSQYAIDSIEKKGIFFGAAKSVWRILRCNPFSPGGHDPAV